MPVITLEAASLNGDQKTALIRELTASASRIMGLPPEAFFVFLKENGVENVGVGGVPLTDRQAETAAP